MAIVMIHGPDDGRHARPDTDTICAALSERPQSAGQHLVHYRCADEQQLVDRLARIDRGQADIILFDPGRCAASAGALHARLGELQVPYIEVHLDRTDRPDPVLPGASGRLAVVSSYEAQGYTLALSLVLESLGCAECENDVHVGT